MMTQEIFNWLKLADSFAFSGDPMGMRACARELWEAEGGRLYGVSVMAEAALYSNENDEAVTLCEEVLKEDPHHLRARLVKAGVAAKEFRLPEELDGLTSLIADAKAELDDLPEGDERTVLYAALLKKAYGWLADADYLAARPVEAADALQGAELYTEDPLDKALLLSKELFLRNYRDAHRDVLSDAKCFEQILGVTPYLHEDVEKLPEKKLSIGYISPDFREHVVASFIEPLIRHFDGKNFSVHLYSLGKRDAITKRIMSSPVSWRDLSGRSPRTAARLIAEDHIDILFDLSGHTQGTALPILAYRPAPVQISGIGYTATTGLSTVDYFLSDTTCLPVGNPAENLFTEKILRMTNSHLCYAPGLVREMPPAAMEAPVLVNGYVTFGCFNNFAKITDELMLLWRAILEQVPDSRLVLKGKMASIPAGREMMHDRIAHLGFDMNRVTLLPYTKDYLEDYRKIDIALDTMPYNGGITTCEALYMGVPVISMSGRTHGARFGASILKSAGVKELAMETDLNYVRRAVQIGQNPMLIATYHSGLRANMKKSPLMDQDAYMRELEGLYRKIWRDFCNKES